MQWQLENTEKQPTWQSSKIILHNFKQSATQPLQFINSIASYRKK